MQPYFSDIYRNQSRNSIFSVRTIPQSILVTGAQGMIGNALAETLYQFSNIGILPRTRLYLASRNWNDISTNKWSQKPDVVTVENSEIEQIGGVDLVLHAASPSNITQINSFEDLLYANTGIFKAIQSISPNRVIFLSSGEVYKGEDLDEGAVSKKFSKFNKRDWYPIAKINAEKEVEEYVRTTNASGSVIRLFHTYGPGVKADDGRSFADVLWGAATNHRITLKSSGLQVRTFLYLSDAINAILGEALNYESKFRIVNVGSTDSLTVLDFAKVVADLSDSKIEYDLDNEFLNSPNHSIIPKVDLLTRSGWTPEVNLETGIEFTLKWINGLMN